MRWTAPHRRGDESPERDTFTLNGNINGSNVVMNGANTAGQQHGDQQRAVWKNGSILAGSVVKVATNGLLLLTGGNGHNFRMG